MWLTATFRPVTHHAKSFATLRLRLLDFCFLLKNSARNFFLTRNICSIFFFGFAQPPHQKSNGPPTSLQPPPSAGKLAAQLKPPFGDSCLLVFADVLHMFYLETKRKFQKSFSGRVYNPYWENKNSRYSFVDDISYALFPPLSRSGPQEEKERGLISRTAASNRAEICFCMYSTAFASISSTALEIEALSFAINRFRKKTKGHSEPKWGVTPGEILFRIESHVFASEEYECKWR